MHGNFSLMDLGSNVQQDQTDSIQQDTHCGSQSPQIDIYSGQTQPVKQTAHVSNINATTTSTSTTSPTTPLTCPAKTRSTYSQATCSTQQLHSFSTLPIQSQPSTPATPSTCRIQNSQKSQTRSTNPPSYNRVKTGLFKQSKDNIKGSPPIDDVIEVHSGQKNTQPAVASPATSSNTTHRNAPANDRISHQSNKSFQPTTRVDLSEQCKLKHQHFEEQNNIQLGHFPASKTGQFTTPSQVIDQLLRNHGGLHIYLPDGHPWGGLAVDPSDDPAADVANTAAADAAAASQIFSKQLRGQSHVDNLIGAVKQGAGAQVKLGKEVCSAKTLQELTCVCEQKCDHGEQEIKEIKQNKKLGSCGDLEREECVRGECCNQGIVDVDDEHCRELNATSLQMAGQSIGGVKIRTVGCKGAVVERQSEEIEQVDESGIDGSILFDQGDLYAFEKEVEGVHCGLLRGDEAKAILSFLLTADVTAATSAAGINPDNVSFHTIAAAWEPIIWRARSMQGLNVCNFNPDNLNSKEMLKIAGSKVSKRCQRSSPSKHINIGKGSKAAQLAGLKRKREVFQDQPGRAWDDGNRIQDAHSLLKSAEQTLNKRGCSQRACQIDQQVKCVQHYDGCNRLAYAESILYKRRRQLFRCNSFPSDFELRGHNGSELHPKQHTSEIKSAQSQSFQCRRLDRDPYHVQGQVVAQNIAGTNTNIIAGQQTPCQQIDKLESSRCLSSQSCTSLPSSADVEQYIRTPNEICQMAESIAYNINRLQGLSPISSKQKPQVDQVNAGISGLHHDIAYSPNQRNGGIQQLGQVLHGSGVGLNGSTRLQMRKADSVAMASVHSNLQNTQELTKQAGFRKEVVQRRGHQLLHDFTQTSRCTNQKLVEPQPQFKLPLINQGQSQGYSQLFGVCDSQRTNTAAKGLSRYCNGFSGHARALGMTQMQADCLDLEDCRSQELANEGGLACLGDFAKCYSPKAQQPSDFINALKEGENLGQCSTQPPKSRVCGLISKKNTQDPVIAQEQVQSLGVDELEVDTTQDHMVGIIQATQLHPLHFSQLEIDEAGGISHPDGHFQRYLTNLGADRLVEYQNMLGPSPQDAFDSLLRQNKGKLDHLRHEQEKECHERVDVGTYNPKQSSLEQKEKSINTRKMPVQSSKAGEIDANNSQKVCTSKMHGKVQHLGTELNNTNFHICINTGGQKSLAKDTKCQVIEHDKEVEGCADKAYGTTWQCTKSQFYDCLQSLTSDDVQDDIAPQNGWFLDSQKQLVNSATPCNKTPTNIPKTGDNEVPGVTIAYQRVLSNDQLNYGKGLVSLGNSRQFGIKENGQHCQDKLPGVQKSIPQQYPLDEQMSKLYAAPVQQAHSHTQKFEPPVQPICKPTGQSGIHVPVQQYSVILREQKECLNRIQDTMAQKNAVDCQNLDATLDMSPKNASKLQRKGQNLLSVPCLNVQDAPTLDEPQVHWCTQLGSPKLHVGRPQADDFISQHQNHHVAQHQQIATVQENLTVIDSSKLLGKTGQSTLKICGVPEYSPGQMKLLQAERDVQQTAKYFNPGIAERHGSRQQDTDMDLPFQQCYKMCGLRCLEIKDNAQRKVSAKEENQNQNDNTIQQMSSSVPHVNATTQPQQQGQEKSMVQGSQQKQGHEHHGDANHLEKTCSQLPTQADSIQIGTYTSIMDKVCHLFVSNEQVCIESTGNSDATGRVQERALMSDQLNKHTDKISSVESQMMHVFGTNEKDVHLKSMVPQKEKIVGKVPPLEQSNERIENKENQLIGNRDMGMHDGRIMQYKVEEQYRHSNKLNKNCVQCSGQEAQQLDNHSHRCFKLDQSRLMASQKRDIKVKEPRTNEKQVEIWTGMKSRSGQHQKGQHRKVSSHIPPKITLKHPSKKVLSGQRKARPLVDAHGDRNNLLRKSQKDHKQFDSEHAKQLQKTMRQGKYLKLQPQQGTKIPLKHAPLKVNKRIVDWKQLEACEALQDSDMDLVEKSNVQPTIQKAPHQDGKMSRHENQNNVNSGNTKQQEQRTPIQGDQQACDISKVRYEANTRLKGLQRMWKYWSRRKAKQTRLVKR